MLENCTGESMRIFTTLLTSLLLSLSSLSLASNFAVNGLQAPAWIEREGERIPLYTDSNLNVQDVILTGDNGKVWLQMADGAIVKLGNNTMLRVNSLAIQKDPYATAPTLEAGINVIVGAFRYTTSKLQEHLSQNWQRRIDIQLAESTIIGIRGTDLWGQVDNETQFVVLLEGNINITPKNGSTPAVLDKALQIFKIENGNQLPVSTVNMSAVQTLAPETELDFGQGIQKTNSKYVINLASTQSLNKAQGLVNDLAKQGYTSSVKSLQIQDTEWHRVVINNLITKEDARTLAERLTDNVDIISPWVQ
jgi:hypothetical protein